MKEEKKKEFFKKPIKFLNDESIEPRVRILNFTLIVLMVASIISIIPMYIYQTGSIIPNVILAIGCLLGELGYIKYHSVDTAALIIVSFSVFYILPSMYFTAGGMNSAMPIWLVMSSILAYILVVDKLKYILFSACVLMTVTCITVEYLYPETVTALDGKGAVFSDYILGSIIVSILLLFVFSIHEKTDKRQRIILERQKEELIQKQKELEIAHNNDKMRLLEESQRTLAEYHDIIAHAGMGIWFITIFKDHAPIMRGNEKMLQILGVESQSLTEEELYDYWNDRIVESDRPLLNHCMEEMLAGNSYEITYQWMDDHKGLRYVRCGGTAVKKEDGNILFRGYHSDVTSIVEEDQLHKKELDQAREIAETANKAKSTFLFNMSHDIRTPMNAILGFTHLMENHLEEPETLDNYLHKIESSGVYLLSIINNVLDMARIENEDVELDLGYTDIRNDNRSILDLFVDDINKKNLSVTYDIDIQHQYILADSQRITQILVNLISNAVKYTPDGGKIHIEIKEEACEREGYGLYSARISDTGIGMSKEFQHKIFDSFARERSTTESRVIGTGLGMAIVKRLVDMMGGRIDLESEVGKGSTFTVTMELKIADSPEMYKKQNTSTENIDMVGRRVLLAEDNDLNAEIAMAILEEAGILVDRAADGVECVDLLSRANEGYYDVILMDVQMPNLDGYEATKKIRTLKNSSKSAIPIIAITANAFAEDRENALASGMNGHLTKPIEIKKLMKTLAAVLK